MSARVGILKNSVLAITTMLAIGAAASSLAAPPVGHSVGAGGFHGGGYRGGYYGGGHGYSGWHGQYYGGWRGYGGYYGPWRGGWAGGWGWGGWGWGGWGWGGWGWGGWGWGWAYPWVGLGWYAPIVQYEAPAVQYEVVQPPPSGMTPSSPAPTQGRWTDLFAYPKGGQSSEQQIRDREECRKWAVEQSGFDPAQPTHENASDWAAKRDGYLRAETACLQARNYSVK